MDINYYLLCRKEYNCIISNLENIICHYEYICDLTKYSEIDTEYDPTKEETNKHFFIKKIIHIKQLKKVCDKKIHELCVHDFIEDDIDISPDESRHITYCRICEYTKPN